MERYEPLAFAVYSGRTPEMKAVVAPLRMPADRMTAGELEETCILGGGDPFSPKDKVAPGVLSVLRELNPSLQNTKDKAQDEKVPIRGRRLELAKWIDRKSVV